MNKLLNILCFAIVLFSATYSNAEIILVENTNNSGDGSLRDAVSLASISANDTILIDIKGVITLSTPIQFVAFTALTIIGPHPKHTSITPSPTCSGSLFDIISSSGIKITGVGFVGGNDFTRHVTLTSCTGTAIEFEDCLFEDGILTTTNGAAVEAQGSNAKFNRCSFINNTARTGGAMRFAGFSDVEIMNSTFSGNYASANSGAISLVGNSNMDMLYCTVINNSSSGGNQALFAGGATAVRMENTIIGNNGTARQLRFNGSVFSLGGNRILQNYSGEETSIPSNPTDITNETLNFGLRSTILEDGFGRKYWPIIDNSSDLINAQPATVRTPNLDARMAPRSLYGGGANNYPDAGAAEHTHLRVLNNSGNPAIPNSFLWCLELAQRTDAVNYIEFDMSSVPVDITFSKVGEMESKAYIIDGFSQPGSSTPGPSLITGLGVTAANIPINLIGGSVITDCLLMAPGTSGSIIQGLRIRSFAENAIHINETNISIYGCEIGIDSGGGINSNQNAGVLIHASNTKIGGWKHWQRNVITGNGNTAGMDESNIFIATGNSTEIYGNIIGGKADGLDAFSGIITTFGIKSQTAFDIIGSDLINTGNVIVSHEYGIFNEITGDFNKIQGNNIGLGWDGSTAIGNSVAGIYIKGGDNNLIGGEDIKFGNIIANNQSGIVITDGLTSAINNSILGNSIYNNTEQGIDFYGDNTVYPNDGLTSTSESNLGLDFPSIIYADNCNNTRTLTSYQLSVPTGTSYRVEFFSVSSPDATNGEGEKFLGSETVTPTTNPEVFTFDHGELLAIGTAITSTLTQISSKNTSEFGNNVTVVAGSIADASFSYGTICAGVISTPTVTIDADDTYRFSTDTPGGSAILDPMTGEFSNGIENSTYDIIRNVGGACGDEDTVSVTVVEIDETFLFPDFCPSVNGAPSFTATSGGTFALIGSTDAALIDDGNGTITGGIEGTSYNVRYVIESIEGCFDTAFADVIVIPTDESFTINDFCARSLSEVAVVAESGGTFSFSPLPTDGTSINPTTGQLNGGIEGNSYEVVHEIGSCNETDTITVATILTNEAFTYPNFCPDEIGSPLTIDSLGGTFSLLTAPISPTTINGTTGEITNAIEGEIYDVIYTIGTCDDKDTVQTMVYTVNEAFTFPDFCPGETSHLPVADTIGTYSFSIDPADGASINVNSGLITLPVEGTTYPVVHTVTTIKGCIQTDTLMVLAIELNEFFEFPDLCKHEVGFPEGLAMDIGTTGTFSITSPFDPLPAVINPTTGEFSNGVEGEEYDIRYVLTDGTCFDSMDVIMQVISVPTGFNFEAFCPGLDSPVPSVEDTDITEGTFSFDSPPLDMAVIDENTGVISNATEGETYTVKYKVDYLSCTDSAIQFISVVEVKEEFDFPNFCWESGGIAIPDSINGTFSFGFPEPAITDAVELNALTGVITAATESESYNIIHTHTNGTCSQSDSLVVIALGVDESFIFPDYCAEVESPAPISAIVGGLFSFDPALTDGATIDADSGIIYNGIEGTNYGIKYTLIDTTGLCTESSTESVIVLGVDESFSTADFCAEFESEVIIPEEPFGTFSLDPLPTDATIIESATGIVSLATPGATYTIRYDVGTCGESSTNIIKALPSEVADFTLLDHCANEFIEATIEGTGSGTFSFNPTPVDGATIDENTGVINNAIGGLYTVQYITPGSIETCKDSLTTEISLYNTPVVTAITSDTIIYCPAEDFAPINTTVDENTDRVYWYEADTTGAIIHSLMSYTPETLNVGSNLYYVQPVSIESCLGSYTPFEISLSDTAGMFALTDFDICLGSPAPLEAYGGVAYNWITDIPLSNATLPAVSAFSLNEETYRVDISNADGCIVQDSIQVGFLSRFDCDVEIYNAFSPNGDGKNDTWYIENLVNYIPNTVYVYNRWGNEVFKVENYDNINAVWSGEDANGNLLPPNTYFYVLITDEPSENTAGWVQLVR